MRTKSNIAGRNGLTLTLSFPGEGKAIGNFFVFNRPSGKSSAEFFFFPTDGVRFPSPAKERPG